MVFRVVKAGNTVPVITGVMVAKVTVGCDCALGDAPVVSALLSWSKSKTMFIKIARLQMHSLNGFSVLHHGFQSAFSSREYKISCL